MTDVLTQLAMPALAIFVRLGIEAESNRTYKTPSAVSTKAPTQSLCFDVFLRTKYSPTREMNIFRNPPTASEALQHKKSSFIC
jgi:hypothetical protein